MAFDFNSFGSAKAAAPKTAGDSQSNTATASKPKVGNFSFGSFGSDVTNSPQEKQKSASTLGFLSKDIQGTATKEDQPGGLAGFATDVYKSTLGSSGLTGLAQAPVRPIAIAMGAAAKEDIQKSRKELATTADNFIAMATKEADPTRKKNLLALATKTLQHGDALQKESEKADAATPQSTSNFGDIERVAGQALNTALTFAPLSKGATVASAAAGEGRRVGSTLGKRVISGALEGAKYGAGFGAGTSLADEQSLGGVAKSTAVGALGGAAVGGAIPLAVEGVKGVASSFAQKSADKAAQSAQEAALIESKVPDASIATKTINEKGKVVRDIKAQEVVKQGVPEADVALIKSGAPADQAKMLKMLDTRVAQKSNSRIIERASDIPGNTFIESTVKPLQETNKKAGAALDVVARGLAGKKVDVSPAIDELASKLDSSGIKIARDGKTLKFKGSDFEGIRGAQSALQNVWDRAVRVAKTGDALQAHRVKRYIDEVVNYGKMTEGLSGRAENILKGFRKGVDGLLDETFPAYNKANTVYADTIGELTKIAQALGKNFKVGTSFADAKVGVTLRRLFSNTQSRAQLLQVLESAQGVAKKYGAKIDEDVITQAKFADILEKLLGSEAPTSFQGNIEKTIGYAERGHKIASDIMDSKNIAGATIKTVGHLRDITRGINEQNMIKALRELLQSGIKKSSNLGVHK